ncbi:hypothetical protein OESDEN_19224 [Oesophagostomum dentatum]|uniref:long-chain-fatty-acid--CoA ligase n=1 Tax=Oesophagostomum dentatum TaxID=61180 RepID=A0A0B1SB38_OESDE|nr:hypothetical protein OESDEN_19224 [Oesophagostomum dentatum]
MSNVSGWAYMSEKLAPEIMTPSTVALSYLPLSHMMEEVCHWTLLMYGARVGFYSGSIPRLTEDIQALKPTAIMAVPRILNRLFSGIQVRH